MSATPLSATAAIPAELSLEEVKKWKFGAFVESIVSVELLGQQGALSRSFKFVISKTADAPADLPTTFCVKLHTENPVPHKHYKYMTEVSMYTQLFSTYGKDQQQKDQIQKLVPKVYHSDITPMGRKFEDGGLVLVLEFLDNGTFFKNEEGIQDLAVAKSILEQFKQLQLVFKTSQDKLGEFTKTYPFVWSGFDVTFMSFFPGSAVTNFDEKVEMIAGHLSKNMAALVENCAGYPRLQRNMELLKKQSSDGSFKDRILESLFALKNDTTAGLVHGDLKLDNIFMSNNGGDIKVIDWQGPTLGKPLADVVYFTMQSITTAAEGDEAAARARVLQIQSLILDLFTDMYGDGTSREHCSLVLKACLWMHLCLYSLFAQTSMYQSEQGTATMKSQLGSYVDCFIRGALNTTELLASYY